MDSYAHGASSVPLIGETIGKHFDGIAARFPETDAVVSCRQGVRLSYAELRAETDRFARGLMALGVQHGDRVGIWSPNNAEWIVAQFATPKIGAILVNVNPAYRTSEVAYVLEQSGVSVLLCAVRHKTSEYLRMIEEVRPSLPQLRTVVVIGDDDRRASRRLARVDGGRRDGRPDERGGVPRALRALPVRRRDQHPVHFGDDRLPERRDALAPQHPQQRLLHRRRLPLHRARPRLHPGAVLSLLRHGARRTSRASRTARRS